MWRIFLFFSLFSPSVCLHLFVSVFVFIVLSADSIITTIKKLLKISITTARLMLLCCQCWHERSTITLDGCSVAEVDPKMRGTFCAIKRIWLFIGFSLPDNSEFKQLLLFFLSAFVFSWNFLGFNLEWKKMEASTTSKLTTSPEERCTLES